jgi:large conductance mechanosensitive channel
MLKEFKEFITKGNVMDMAVGVIIGGAFQSIVTSLVNDIIMPAIAVFTGKVDFSDLVLTIGNSSIKYGSFITTVVDFLIIAFSIFIAIKSFNKLNGKTKENLEKMTENNKYLKKTKKKLAKLKHEEEKQEPVQEVKEPETKQCPFCYLEINYKATKCPHCTSDLEEVKI